MKLEAFDYTLPQELIAQQAVTPRDSSRLMYVERSGGSVSHHRFSHILSLLPDNALLIMNDSRVFPARILCRKKTGAAVEVMLTRRITETQWQGLLKPARKIPVGTELEIDGGRLVIKVLHKKPTGEITFELFYDGDIWDALQQYGKAPLPPYIHEDLENPDRYQTVYARHRGSVAAPTAGLHFTPELLEKLGAKGVETAFVTLHVGPGTFRPVKTENIEDHIMDEEYYEIPEETLEKITRAQREKRKIVAVGTTSVRTVESAWKNGKFQSPRGWTRLFIYPGFHFSVIEGLITNFHLPKSTLLMLTGTFAGVELIGKAYKEAVRERYRFYSLGDAMLIL